VATCGVIVGTLGARALTAVMRGLIYGISANDPVTFAAVPLLLLAVSLAAAYVPARRASRVDPLIALRHE
jgi:ABC-type antimicrobial peptide transport system permease subunit